MKFEWTWILSIFLAIVIAIFSVVNVDPVKVNYVFGEAEWPLVLVILGAALLGAAVNGFIALFRSITTKNELKELRKDLQEKEEIISKQQDEITHLQQEQNHVIEHTAVPPILNPVDEEVVMDNEVNKLDE